MRANKILIVVITLASLLAGIVALRVRRDKPVGPSVTENSRLIAGPAFEVQVEMPASIQAAHPGRFLASSSVTTVDHGSITMFLKLLEC
ncbi:MAG TPA: hypothetical protein VIT88_03000 [Pyrinomonadaceae bacterium]